MWLRKVHFVLLLSLLLEFCASDPVIVIIIANIVGAADWSS